MTAEIHVIQPPQADKSVVDLLEHYLERARAGEFGVFMVVFMDRDGFTGSSHSLLPCVSTIVGAIERAKWDLIQEAHA